MRRGIVTLITYIQSDHIDQIRWASGVSIKKKSSPAAPRGGAYEVSIRFL